jgi:LacI family transcriptional regulator
MGRKTTLKELSQLLRLSISTISKALSDSKEISEETKERVRGMARTCNYRQNKLASGFRAGVTKAIGIVVPNLIDVYYVEALAGIEKYLTARGFNMMVAFSNDSQLKEITVLESLCSGYVDGLIISNANETLDKASSKSMSVPIDDGIPMVLFGRNNPMVNCDQVLNDFSKISFRLVEYLHKNQNCNRIALIGMENEHTNARLKIEGFKIAMDFFKLRLSSESLMIGEKRSLVQKIREMVQEKKYDGILCLDYESHNILIEVLEDYFQSIHSIQIVTFGNTHLLRRLPSASIDLQAEKIGQTAAKMLLNRIRAKKTNNYQAKFIEGNLVRYNINANTEVNLC